MQRSPTDVTEHLCPLCNGRRKNARAGKLVVQKLATEGEGLSVRWQGDDRNSNDHNRYLRILALPENPCANCAGPQLEPLEFRIECGRKNFLPRYESPKTVLPKSLWLGLLCLLPGQRENPRAIERMNRHRVLVAVTGLMLSSFLACGGRSESPHPSRPTNPSQPSTPFAPTQPTPFQ